MAATAFLLVFDVFLLLSSRSNSCRQSWMKARGLLIVEDTLSYTGAVAQL
jgi:hypothetical protein